MRLRYLAVVALCLLSLAPLGVRAADAEKPATEPIATEISFASMSALAGFLKDLGIPVPPMLTAEGVDQTFPFLGGVDDTRPASFTILMRPDLPEQNRGYFSVPAKDPASYMGKMKEQGVKTLVEGQDVYPLGPVFIKFTKDRVLFGGTDTALKNSDDTAMIKQYADGKTLAAMWGDIRELRKTHPEVLKAFVDDLKKKDEAKPSEGSAAEKKGEKLGRDFVYGYFQNTIERLEMAVSKGANDTLAARILVAPSVPWAGTDAPVAVPVLPPECAGRVDLVFTFPTADVLKAGFKTLISLTDNPTKNTKVSVDEMCDILAQLTAAHLTGEANSLGWAVTDGACVAYVVRQNSAEQDVDAIVKKLAADMQKLDAIDGEKEHLKVDGYTTAAGAKVVREILIDKGVAFAYVDFLPKGKRVYITVSDSDKKFVETMPMDKDVAGQTLKKGAYLQLDAAKMLDAIQKKAKDATPLPPGIAEALAKITAPITLTVVPGAEGVKLELTVPMAIIKAGASVVPKDGL